MCVRFLYIWFDLIYLTFYFFSSPFNNIYFVVYMEYGFLFPCWHLSICDEIIESNSVYSLLCVCVGVFFLLLSKIFQFRYCIISIWSHILSWVCLSSFPLVVYLFINPLCPLFYFFSLQSLKVVSRFDCFV